MSADKQLPGFQFPSLKTLLLLLTLGAGGIVLLLPITVLLAHRSWAESALNEKKAELAAAGVPMTLAEVNRQYHDHGRDPAENAAPIYHSAFAETISEDLSMDQLAGVFRISSFYEPLSPTTFSAMREVVSANEAALALYQEAAAYPYVRFDLDFTEGAALLIPHVREMRDAARILGFQAVLLAVDGESDAAGEVLEVILQMVNHVSEEPTLISQLTQIAIEGIARGALERVLDEVEVAPHALLSMRQRMMAFEYGLRLKEALGAEIAFGQWIYDTVAQGEWIDDEMTAQNGQERFIKLYRRTGMLSRDHHFYLTQMGEYLRIVNLPFAERVQIEWEEEDFSAAIFRGRLVAGIALPTVSRVIEADNRAVTYLRATQVALAAEQHRLEKGAFPATLKELVPEYLETLPLDPYSADGAFEWVREKGAVFVRSAGVIDLRNDEGEVQIGFRLPVR